MDSQWVKQLEKERDDRVKNDPRAAAFQKEINLALVGVKDPMLRICLIMKKIGQGQKIISDNCKKLNNILSGVPKNDTSKRIG